MKYAYKERVKMARKLKIFLAIFFAAITFFTGKVILDKTFANDGPNDLTVSINWDDDDNQNYTRPYDVNLHLIGDVVEPYDKVAIIDLQLLIDYICEYGAHSWTEEGPADLKLSFVKVSDEEAESWGDYNTFETIDSEYVINFVPDRIDDDTVEIVLETNADVIKIAQHQNLEFLSNEDFIEWWADLSELVKFDTSEVASMSNFLYNNSYYEPINVMTDFSWMNGLDRSGIEPLESNYERMIPYIEGETILPDWYDGEWVISSSGGTYDWASFIPNQYYEHYMNPYAVNLGNLVTTDISSMFVVDWEKEENTWTTRLPDLPEISNIRAYIDRVENYFSDATENNPKSATDGVIQINNTYSPQLTVTKYWYDDYSEEREMPEVTVNYELEEAKTFEAELDFDLDGGNFNNDGGYVRDLDDNYYLNHSLSDYTPILENSVVKIKGINGETIALYNGEEPNLSYLSISPGNIAGQTYMEDVVRYVNNNNGFRLEINGKLSPIIDEYNSGYWMNSSDQLYFISEFTIDDFETSEMTKVSDLDWYIIDDYTWQYIFNVDIASEYTIYESSVPAGYTSSNDINNPIVIPEINDVTIENTADTTYFEFDSSTNILRIFRDESGKYSDTIGTKTYYTYWDSVKSAVGNDIARIVIEDRFVPVTMRGLFRDMSNLVEISNIENLDTSQATDMSYMFQNCRSLTNIDLSSFDTSNVTDMVSMFAGCDNLLALDLSSFDTSNVTDMSFMFNFCQKLVTLNISSFDTSNVTNMNTMFQQCVDLENVDFSSFDTSSVTNMGGMFSCAGVRGNTYDISNFDTSNVTSMSSMFWASPFSACDLSNFDTSNVTDMSNMFGGCSNLTSLDLSNFDTSNVTNMWWMFKECSNLTSLDLSNFDTSSVTDMRYMFEDCSKLTELDISTFDTGNVTKMESMFDGCSELTTLDLNLFDTSSVEIMQYMFQDCSSLTTLNLNNFDTSNVTNMTRMFAGCSNLQRLDISSFDTSSVTSMINMFSNLTNLASLSLGTDWTFLSNNGLSYSWKRKGDSTVYTAEELTSSYDGSTMAGTYIRPDMEVTAIVYDSGEMVFQLGSTPDSTKGNVLGTYTGFEAIDYVNGMQIPWYSNRSIITNITFNTEVNPISTRFWFWCLSNLTTIDNLEYLNTSDVEYMDRMFCECDSLTSLDLSSFDTSNVISMSEMFYGCNDLETIDFSGWYTSKVNSMESMFFDCQSLITLDLSDFDTSNVEEISEMFGYCRNLVSIDLSSFDISSASNLISLFNGCSSLTTLDLSSFDTSNIQEMVAMFKGCSSLVDIDLSSFDTSNAENFGEMFQGCTNLETLDLKNFDTSKLMYSYNMFDGCSNLTTIYVSSAWNVGAVEISDEMFYNCTSLIGGQGTEFDSNYIDKTRAIIDEGVTNPGYLTYEQYDFDSMAYAVLDTSDNSLKFFRDDAGKYYEGQVIGTKTYYYNVENLVYPRHDESGESFSAVHWLNNSNYIEVVQFLDDIAPKNTAFWFYYCSNLSSVIDIENLDTSNTINMEEMFSACTNLEVLDVSHFDTSNVEYMDYMFSCCSSLTSLDFSSWDTSNVTNMEGMFDGCENIINLDLSTFDTSSVESMASMFSYCHHLMTLNISTFDTSQVENMSYMFTECSNLISLDISSFDTFNTMDMTNMFSNMPNLSILHLGPDFSFGDNPGLTGYWQRDSTNVVYDAEELMEIYDGSTMADVYRIPMPGEVFAEFDSSTGILRIFRGEFFEYTNGEVIGTKTYYAGLEDITGNTIPLWSGVSSNITRVVIEDAFKPKTAYYLFSLPNVASITGLNNLNTGQTTNMQGMFTGASNLVSLDLSNFNTANVTDMSNMFRDCSDLESVDLSGFDTSNVTTMFGMFTNCFVLDDLDLSDFDTSSVENMNYMFGECRGLTSLDLSTFDTSSVEEMTYMFSGCASLETLDVSTWDTRSATDIEGMFENCESLESLDLSSFDTSDVTSMMQLFYGCKALTSLDISSFDTSGVTDMKGMFESCESLETLDLSHFDTSSVEDMSFMFTSCESLKSLNIDSFDTSSVENMENIFVNLDSLEKIVLGEDFEFMPSTEFPGNLWLRDGSSTLYEAEGFGDNYDGSTMAGTYRVAVQLTITEEVRGNLADINKEFDFTINATLENDAVDGVFPYEDIDGSGILTFTDGTANFSLKHEEDICIYMPKGTVYAIDQDSEGYTLSKSNEAGTLGIDDSDASFIDTLENIAPTGILFNLIPFIILIICGIFGIFLIRKFKYI